MLVGMGGGVDRVAQNVDAQPEDVGVKDSWDFFKPDMPDMEATRSDGLGLVYLPWRL